MKNTFLKNTLFAAVWLLPSASHGEDWPTLGHDNRRSHVSKETLPLPLVESWVYRPPTPPQTAWTGPARWDAYASNEGLQSMRNFDPVFYTIAVGDSVYFGSSSDDAAHCLEAKTGNEKWVVFANAAVRLPPTWHRGNLYFGSDDGYAYCVDAVSGKEKWRFRPAKETRMIPANGKLISMLPVRTGIMIDGEIAYFASSLFPWEDSYLCALDSRSGRKHFVEKRKSVTFQGALLASSARIYAPQGRSAPLIYAKASGSALGEIKGSGGVYCILTEDEQLITIPGNQKEKEDTVQVVDTEKRESIFSVSGANQILVSGNVAYFHQRGQLKAIDRFAAYAAQGEVVSREKSIKAWEKTIDEIRKKKPVQENEIGALKKKITQTRSEIPRWKTAGKAAEKWSSLQSIPSAMALGGDHLILGGDGRVTAVLAASGEKQWETKVKGRVYGLVIANGRLIVSTDLGHIYCFAAVGQ